MKKIFTLIAFLLSLTSFANTIIIKGYVRDGAGKAIANHTIKIGTDSTQGNACVVWHVKTTNANGFYVDTITCNSEIKKVMVYTESCGNIISKVLVITNAITECNFSICSPVPPIVILPVVSYVIVKGYIKDSAGKAIANHAVKIGTDSILGSICNVWHVKNTNASGFYNDTLFCNAAIKYVMVATEACGKFLSNKIAVTNGIAERNFTICVPPVVTPPVVSYVIVKGYVKDSSGKAIANHVVKMGTDITLGSACFVAHGKLTNANGFYIDTIFCSSSIKYVLVATDACGKIVSKKVAVTNNVAEANFIICLPHTITLPSPVPACTVYFTYTQQLVGVRFNSNVSIIAPNDSIISRTWSFGDGDSAYRLIDPVHIFKKSGTYNVCLSIKTAKGCDNKICKTIVLHDSIPNSAGSILEPVKIIILYPNPAHEKLNTLVWNLNTTTSAELSIVDIYGQRKWSNKITLVRGNNNFNINVTMLANGPYFFKVSTVFGVVSRKFYKL
jgi:PKD repeat protein